VVNRQRILGSQSPIARGTLPRVLLDDITVVERSAFVAGPFAALLLGQLGADVIRADRPGGGIDFDRWPITDDGSSIYWASLNAGKRSIAIDTEVPEGQELLAALVTAPRSGAGVYLTNRPIPPPLQYDSLVGLRRDVISVAIMGNSDGSPEVDYTVNAAFGIPWMTGPTDTTEPIGHVLPAWDLLTGAMAAMGAVAADRNRILTGVGQSVRVSLSEVAVATLADLGFVGEVLYKGKDRKRIGNGIFGSFGCDLRSADGVPILVVALTERQWVNLERATGLESSFQDISSECGVDLTKGGDRFKVRSRLTAILEEWAHLHSVDQIEGTFDANAVLWSRYRSLSEALQCDARFGTKHGLLDDVLQPGIGHTFLPRSPLSSSLSDRHEARPAPLLGEHTEEILATSLGLSSKRIGDLCDRKIIDIPTISFAPRK